jgi:hypothetical protein
MLLYFDMCSLQRPCDDRTQVRIRVEAEAVLGLIAVCESGKVGLVSSDALEYETAHNPYPMRREYEEAVLARASATIRLPDAIETRAAEIVAASLRPLDAFHLACAAAAGADYFRTCGDRLLRKARAIQTPPPKVVSPLELTTELGL